MPVSISGTTGYAGPLGSLTVGTTAIEANAVTPAKMSRTGTAGQVLTSGGAGADPSYQALPTSVTSLTAGNGIAVSASTGAVTVSLDFYTGTTIGNTSYPVGSYLANIINGDGCVYASPDLNNNLPGSGLRVNSGSSLPLYFGPATGSAVAGTWRSRGCKFTGDAVSLVQRVA